MARKRKVEAAPTTETTTDTLDAPAFHQHAPPAITPERAIAKTPPATDGDVLCTIETENVTWRLKPSPGGFGQWWAYRRAWPHRAPITATLAEAALCNVIRKMQEKRK